MMFIGMGVTGAVTCWGCWVVFPFALSPALAFLSIVGKDFNKHTQAIPNKGWHDGGLIVNSTIFNLACQLGLADPMTCLN